MTRTPEWTKDSLLYTAKVKSALGQESDTAAITTSLIKRANLHLIQGKFWQALLYHQKKQRSSL